MFTFHPVPRRSYLSFLTVLFVVVRFNKIQTKQHVESSFACHMQDLIKLLLPPALGSTETLKILVHKLSFVKCFAADFVISLWEFGHHEQKEERNMYFLSSLLKSILPPPLFYCSSVLFFSFAISSIHLVSPVSLSVSPLFL